MLAPLLPKPASETPGSGRPEKHHRRAILDALRYVTDNGIKWRALPSDFPPWQTVHGFFTRWSKTGVFEKTTLRITFDIVKRSSDRRHSSSCPAAGRRTHLSWITQARRNVRDYERLPDHSAAFINLSMITMLTRRLTREKRTRTT